MEDIERLNNFDNIYPLRKKEMLLNLQSVKQERIVTEIQISNNKFNYCTRSYDMTENHQSCLRNGKQIKELYWYFRMIIETLNKNLSPYGQLKLKYQVRQYRKSKIITSYFSLVTFCDEDQLFLAMTISQSSPTYGMT